MTRDEFNAWLNVELRKRLPDTHRWLQQQDGVAAFWFSDVFEDLDYNLCVSALSQVWRDGLPAYERERLPAIIMKRHGEIQWQRQEERRRVAQRKRNAEGKGTFYGDPVMRRAMDEACAVLSQEGQHSLSAFCDQYFESREYETAEAWLARPKLSEWSE